MHWLWWIQIVADLVLVGAVIVLLMRLSKQSQPAELGGQPDVEGFMAEASKLSLEFDQLLAQKRELVASTLSGLDRRLAELRALAEELEEPPAPQAPAPKPLTDDDMGTFRQKVAEMAAHGSDAAAIAAATGRPRGEVELVLGLGAHKN